MQFINENSNNNNNNNNSNSNHINANNDTQIINNKLEISMELNDISNTNKINSQSFLGSRTMIQNQQQTPTNTQNNISVTIESPFMHPLSLNHTNQQPNKNETKIKKETNFWIKYRRTLGNEKFLHKIILIQSVIIIIYRFSVLIFAVLS